MSALVSSSSHAYSSHYDSAKHAQMVRKENSRHNVMVINKNIEGISSCGKLLHKDPSSVMVHRGRQAVVTEELLEISAESLDECLDDDVTSPCSTPASFVSSSTYRLDLASLAAALSLLAAERQ